MVRRCFFVLDLNQIQNFLRLLRIHEKGHESCLNCSFRDLVLGGSSVVEVVESGIGSDLVHVLLQVSERAVLGLETRRIFRRQTKRTLLF